MLSLLTSILIVWRYVVRNIVARLNRLSGTMFAIARGDRETAVAVTGSDEIAAMGEAVKDTELGLDKAADYYYYPGFHEPGTNMTLGISETLWEGWRPPSER